MPNRDKTGPEGRGPATGRGLGDCDNATRKDDDYGLGRGGRPRGCGRGRGRGWRRSR